MKRKAIPTLELTSVGGLLLAVLDLAGLREQSLVKRALRALTRRLQAILPVPAAEAIRLDAEVHPQARAMLGTVLWMRVLHALCVLQGRIR
jgi:hypothetical protein